MVQALLLQFLVLPLILRIYRYNLWAQPFITERSSLGPGRASITNRSENSIDLRTLSSRVQADCPSTKVFMTGRFVTVDYQGHVPLRKMQAAR
jgi:hypothetical protein